eukprot:s884_g7.t1
MEISSEEEAGPIDGDAKHGTVIDLSEEEGANELIRLDPQVDNIHDTRMKLQKMEEAAKEDDGASETAPTLPAGKAAKPVDFGMGVSEKATPRPHLPECSEMPWEKGFAGLVLGRSPGSPEVMVLPHIKTMRAAAMAEDEASDLQHQKQSPADVLVKSGFRPLSEDRQPALEKN